ncbi:hypothetical protein [Brachyspira sp. G79]|uniref:hypothetical protein n=1 Tax=Brachyspira sp. G79 TaxID=1358104 RepID=UPI000BD90130|nr:hypothetical protein [Brachyspira sp. G79]PCG19545.1 hypothetical protein KQ44_05505 [Brachyspira sp. G79]
MTTKKRYIIFLSILLALSLYACKHQTKTIIFNNISIDVPEDFSENFLGQAVEADNNRIEYYNSYGVQRKTAIYTAAYTKYKAAYTGIINLEKVRNDIINGLKNNNAIQEFQIVNEGPAQGFDNAYEILMSFYYGPNKTYHKSFSMIHDDGILQIICMYNANSKKDDREINNIIKSVKIIENNTND